MTRLARPPGVRTGLASGIGAGARTRVSARCGCSWELEPGALGPVMVQIRRCDGAGCMLRSERGAAQ